MVLGRIWRRALVSTHRKTLNVAVVGAGPAGFYVCNNLLKNKVLDVNVHIYEKLPCPYGLIRYGVAPDHTEIKNVQKIFEQIALDDRVVYYGNVRVGKDVSVKELKNLYNCIILCCGAELDKKLNIPGEDLIGVYSARYDAVNKIMRIDLQLRDFVQYYNGHPHVIHDHFDLSGSNAIIIGNGNVAIDIARVLMNTESLEKTDISSVALKFIKKSRISHLDIVGRRGPLQASFTTKELRALSAIPKVRCNLDNSNYSFSKSDLCELENRVVKRKHEVLCALKNLSKDCENQINFRFFLNPIKFLEDSNRPNHLAGVLFEHVKLEGAPFKQKAVGTGKYLKIDSQVVFRSTGSVASVVKDTPCSWNNDGTPNTNSKISGIYACGWYKRGSDGVVLNNMYDALEVGETILKDLEKQNISTQKTLTGSESQDPKRAAESLLHSRNVRFVSFDDWLLLDRIEIENGASCSKSREKFLSVQLMLDTLAAIKKKQ